MTDRTVNIPLLRKAVEWAEAEAAKPPELCEWFQGHFILDPADELDQSIREGMGKAPECGTCYCVAGYVASVSADERDRAAFAPEIAQADLGLTNAQADELFHAANTIAEVRRIAEEIAGEAL